ncbi:DinB family protein [Acidicapsa dinghuensis]|uniref:DinB family protein n=1 Tax=Acidicapsa dinghuensis TaxID=2218256 RepID=A0ABW1EMQ0_9BACT|nr:DinB family protein [Acidicapsa dinghuensis]
MTATAESLFVTVALKSWDVWLTRLDKILDALTDEQLESPVVPGRNRAFYIYGHLIAVNDSMIPQLRLGDPLFPEFAETFIKQPDRAATIYPTTIQLRQSWKDLNRQLSELLPQLSPTAWLERHATVSEEDFAKEPHRNRLAVLLSRTSHLSYHLGQLQLREK